MTKPDLSIDLTGPFFRRDPEKTITENVHQMVEGLAIEGERIVKVGWSNSIRGRGGVVGRASSVSGKPWTFHATVTPEFTYPWPHGGVKRYRGGRNKRRNRAFKDAYYRMRSARLQLGVNLTKGIE